MSLFLVAYDIVQSKRRAKVAKLVYSYALGGQKSALEVPICKDKVKELKKAIKMNIDQSTDKVNIIKVEEMPILLGTAMHVEYDDGMVFV